jgi:hypothetical protein
MKDKRLERLLPGLTAKERAVLVLQAARQGEQPDLMVIQSTPPAQAREFNRLINLMNAVNVELAMGIALLRAQIRQTQLKLCWLQSLQMHALEFHVLAAYIMHDTKEPATQSQYEARAGELAAERATVPEVLEVLVGESEESWEAEEQRLRDAIACGDLPATGKGRRTRVRWGDFYRWSGLPPLVYPTWGWGYDVFPDGQASQAEAHQRERRLVQSLVERVPERIAYPKKEGGPLTFSPSSPERESVLLTLLEVVPAEAADHWRAVRAMDIVLGEVALEFDGEDVMDELNRATLEDSRSTLEEIRDAMPHFGVAVAFEEPRDDDIALVRALIAKAAG